MVIFIIIVILAIFLLYKLYNRNEHQTNTTDPTQLLIAAVRQSLIPDITTKVNEVYRGDIDAIRNLGNLARQILTATPNDVLTIPTSKLVNQGELENEGGLKVTGNTTLGGTLTTTGITVLKDTTVDKLNGKDNKLLLNDDVVIDRHAFQLLIDSEMKTINLGRFFINGIDIRNFLIGATLYNTEQTNNYVMNGVNGSSFVHLMIGRYAFAGVGGDNIFNDIADILILQPGFGILLHNSFNFGSTSDAGLILNWGIKPLRVNLHTISLFNENQESMRAGNTVNVFKDLNNNYISTYPEYNHDKTTYMIIRRQGTTSLGNRISSAQVFKVGEHPPVLSNIL